jgi:hypothetical protein
MKGRTTREFTCKTDLWPVIDSWAAETGFVLESKEKFQRIYRKGNRLLMAPAFLEIRLKGRSVTLEAWVSADFYLILTLLSGKKPESKIESGGLTAVVPRKRARDAVNRLLARFDQAPIT